LLYEILDLGTQLEIYDEALFREYLEYPRNYAITAYVPISTTQDGA